MHTHAYAGLTSAQDEPYGWNRVVREGIPQRNVERTTDHIVTITVDQFAAYDVSEPETSGLVALSLALALALTLTLTLAR